MNVHVLVYGTLMRGEANHRRMAGARFIRGAHTAPRFTLLDLGPFPALRENGTRAVRGELYEVTPMQLAALDRFEGVPHLYERTTIPLAGGGIAEAYVQRRTPSRTPGVITSGDWRAYRKERDRARTNQG